MDGIVPFAVKILGKHSYRSQFFLGGCFALFVTALIPFRFDLEALLGRGGGNEFDHDFVADQSLAAPVLRDVAKHSVLNFVPLARRRWEMADTDLQPGLIAELLQTPFPKATT